MKGSGGDRDYKHPLTADIWSRDVPRTRAETIVVDRSEPPAMHVRRTPLHAHSRRVEALTQPRVQFGRFEYLIPSPVSEIAIDCGLAATVA